MIENSKLYAVVVWFHPTEKNLDSLLSYVYDVKKVIIIDNSPQENYSLLRNKNLVDEVLYFPNLKNQGIAAALNQGCKLAAEMGATWILTMDQDSKFDTAGVENLVKEANLYSEFDDVAIFSALQCYSFEKPVFSEKYTERTTVMTSGNLLSVSHYLLVGGFRDDFFIDLVDDEYCCRLKRKGFKIIMINTIHLQHHLGNGEIHSKRKGWGKRFIEHSALRHYYIIRNMLIVMQLYPEQKKYYRKQFFKRIKRLLLYDNRNKLKKIYYVYLGFRDYKKGRTGELDSKTNVHYENNN